MHYSPTHKSFIKTLIFGAVGAGCIASQGILPIAGYLTFEAVASLAVMGKAFATGRALGLKYGLPSMVSHKYHNAILKNSARKIINSLKVSQGPIKEEAKLIVQIILAHAVNNYFPQVMAHFNEAEAVKSRPNFSTEQFIKNYPQLYYSIFKECDKYLAKNKMSIKALTLNCFFSPLQEYFKKAQDYKLSQLDVDCLEYFMGHKNNLSIDTKQALEANKELISFTLNNISKVAEYRNIDPKTLLNQLPQLIHLNFFEQTIHQILLHNPEKVDFLTGYFKTIEDAFPQEIKIIINDYHCAMAEKAKLNNCVGQISSMTTASVNKRNNKI